jgi:hypothetical protein
VEKKTTRNFKILCGSGVVGDASAANDQNTDTEQVREGARARVEYDAVNLRES